MTEKLHYCRPFMGPLHVAGYGAGARYCTEFDTGNLWVGNSEYANRVNYCPFCGYKAIKQMESK